MKLTNGLLALGLAALPASALALGDTNLFGPGLLRDDAGDLVRKLGDKDYKVRRDAFRKLEAMGDSARAALETAAKGDDSEIRWNASRLLDRLDDDEPAQDKKSGGGVHAGNGGARTGEGLKVRVGGDSDGDEDDAQSGPAPRMRVRVFGNDDLQQQMRELERRMQEFQKQFEDGGDGHGAFRGSPFGVRMFDNPFGGAGDGGVLHLGPGSSFQRSTSSDGKSESLTIKVDENGHVTAEQQKDGKTTKFDADSLEAFQKEHPELLRSGPAVIAVRPGAGGGFFRVGPNGQDAQDPDAQQDARPRRKVKVKAPVETPSEHAKAKDPAQGLSERDDGDANADAAPPKPKLGIELAPVAPAVADYFELEGDALQIVRVVDDMPAAKRGLKARDILLEVDGKPVHVFDDVVRALADADPSKVPLLVLRHGEKKKL